MQVASELEKGKGRTLHQRGIDMIHWFSRCRFADARQNTDPVVWVAQGQLVEQMAEPTNLTK